MSRIKIMTDSASDISAENEKKYEIHVVPFKMSMGDKSYTSRVDFDNEKFYKMMDEYDGIPDIKEIEKAKTIFEADDELSNSGFSVDTDLFDD